MGKWDRNKCFLIGVLLVLFGVQFRAVQRVTLTQHATDIIAKHTAPEGADSSASYERMFMSVGPRTPKKTIEPPRWLGLALISVGAVLVMGAYVMPKPGG